MRGGCGVGDDGWVEVGGEGKRARGLQRLQRQLNLLAELLRAWQPRRARLRRLSVTRHDHVQLARLAILAHHPRHGTRHGSARTVGCGKRGGGREGKGWREAWGWRNGGAEGGVSRDVPLAQGR